MIYFIQAGENGPIKIGRSEDPQKRLEQLQVGNHQKLSIIWICENEQYEDDCEFESILHDIFKEYKLRGEWFRWCKQVEKYIDKYCVVFEGCKTKNGKYINAYESFLGGVHIISIMSEEDIRK